jgi:integrase
MASVAFTDTMIKAATASKGKRVELTDARCPGLVLRVTDTGSKTFAHKYWSKTQQKPVRVTLGSYPELSLADARSKVHAGMVKRADGGDPHSERVAERAKAKDALTFDELAGLYIEQYAKVRKASWKNDQVFLKRARAKWKHRAVGSITDDDVAGLLDEIAATAPVSANRTQSVLHKVFAWAKEPGRKYVKINPVADMPRRAKESSKERVLTDDELKTLWHGLDDPDLPAERPVALALRFILLTMARPGEVAGALAAELQGLTTQEPEWHLPSARTKNRRPHIVPLSDAAVAVIREAMPEDQPVVFRSKYEARASIARNSLSQALIEIRTHLKLTEPFTPHDLRRTAATLARRAGAARGSVKAMLNHVEDDITATYDLYSMLAEKRETGSILEKEIMRVVGASRPAQPATAPRHPETKQRGAARSA